MDLGGEGKGEWEGGEERGVAVCLCLPVHVCACLCLSASVSVCVCVSVWVRVWVWVCDCVCVWVCVCMCLCVCAVACVYCSHDRHVHTYHCHSKWSVCFLATPPQRSESRTTASARIPQHSGSLLLLLALLMMQLQLLLLRLPMLPHVVAPPTPPALARPLHLSHAGASLAQQAGHDVRHPRLEQAISLWVPQQVASLAQCPYLVLHHDSFFRKVPLAPSILC